MKQLFVIVCCCVLMTACRKQDHCSPRPFTPGGKCELLNFSVFSKLLLKTLDLYQYKGMDEISRLGYFASYGESQSLRRVRTATNGYLIDVKNGDTVLNVVLDSQGRPVTFTARDRWAGSVFNITGSVQYHAGSKPSLITQKIDGRQNTLEFTYDRFNNLIKAHNKDMTDVIYTFVYDYSRPTRGGRYEIFGLPAVFGWLMMVDGGFLDNSVAHLRSSYECLNGGYPIDRCDYKGYVLNAEGYVKDYEGSTGSYHLIWSCTNTSAAK